MHWYGGKCLRQFVPDYAVGFRLGWVHLPESLCHRRSQSDSSTETDIDTRLTKALAAVNKLSVVWKSDLTDKMKRSFFQGVIVSILLYGCTTWTLTKQLEKKLDGNYTRSLPAILNKSWMQHYTKQQLYGHQSRKLSKLDEPDMQSTAQDVGTIS